MGFHTVIDDVLAQRARLTAIEAALGQARASAASADGGVRVVVDGRGRLVDVEIDDRAPRRLTAAGVAAAIVRLAAAATARIDEQAEALRLDAVAAAGPQVEDCLAPGDAPLPDPSGEGT